MRKSTRIRSGPLCTTGFLSSTGFVQVSYGIAWCNGLGSAGKSLVLLVLPEDRRFENRLRLESERSWMMSEMPCIRSLL
jgi:hypothetical protein